MTKNNNLWKLPKATRKRLLTELESINGKIQHLQDEIYRCRNKIQQCDYELSLAIHRKAEIENLKP